MADGRYSEDEVALILARAAELQAGQSDSRRMSLAEVQTAASEAGIDTALVVQAARELAAPRPSKPSPTSGWLGAPRRVRFERVVPGIMSEQEIAAAIGMIVSETGLNGRIEHIGSSTTVWSSPDPRQLRITFSRGRDETHIRFEEYFKGTAGGIFGGLMGGLGGASVGVVVPVCVAALGMPALIPVGLALTLGGSFLFARSVFGAVVRHRTAALEELAEDLVRQTRLALAPASSETEPEPEASSS